MIPCESKYVNKIGIRFNYVIMGTQTCQMLGPDMHPVMILGSCYWRMTTKLLNEY